MNLAAHERTYRLGFLQNAYADILSHLPALTQLLDLDCGSQTRRAATHDAHVIVAVCRCLCQVSSCKCKPGARFGTKVGCKRRQRMPQHYQCTLRDGRISPRVLLFHSSWSTAAVLQALARTARSCRDMSLRLQKVK
jgi:hypothetical protein